jgi:hypothetical protein
LTKQALIFLLILSCIIKVKSQYNTEFINYRNTGRSISTNLEFDAGSNGTNQILINKLLLGGYISAEDKAQSAKYLRGYNNFGVNLNYDVNAFIKGGKKHDFLIGIKNQEILNATYTKDFFNLMFYGNQAYKGKTADLAFCNVNALRFQEIKFGAILHSVDSVAKIGVSLSFIKGEQLFYIRTNKNSSLFYYGLENIDRCWSKDGNRYVYDRNTDFGDKFLHSHDAYFNFEMERGSKTAVLTYGNY